MFPSRRPESVYVWSQLVGPFRHRALIRILAWRDISGRYRGSLLGSGWSLLTPLLMLGGADFDVVLAQMIANPRGYDLPARAANAFNDAPDKERGSILSTARRHLAFLDDPRIVAALSRSDFSPDDLKARKITVYLVMPPARLSANRAFVRAFFGQAINAVMASAGKPALFIAARKASRSNGMRRQKIEPSAVSNRQ